VALSISQGRFRIVLADVGRRMGLRLIRAGKFVGLNRHAGKGHPRI
jgi:hypothetical protein